MKSYIKNFKKVFSKYQNPYMNYQKRFSEDKQQKWKKTYEESIQEFSLKNLLTWYKLGGPFVRHYALEQDILDFINTFTCDKHGEKIVGDETINNGKMYLLEKWPKRIKSIETIGRNIVRIHVRGKNNVIAAQRFTSVYEPASDLLPTLLTTQRFNRCHSGSLAISRMMPEDENPVVVTGKVFSDYKKHFYLHTWVETKAKDSNKEYVIDHNLNACLPKSTYYKLFHPEVYERISRSQLDDDVKAGVFNWINENSSYDLPILKIYCADRNEAMALFENYKSDANAYCVDNDVNENSNI